MAYIGNDIDAIFIPSSVNTSTDLRINGGALTQTGGDVNLDGGTFFLDESANRVGIGTITPGVTLDVVGTIRATNINALDLSVEDKNIVIGDVASPTNTTADGGGVTLKGAVDKTIAWLNATAAWTFSEHISIASAKEYRIAGTKVLDATSLGSAVVSSSLTSVGTIATGVWNGSVIGKVYLDATVVSTGDTGTVTSTMILDGTILDADINASAEIAVSKLADGTARQLLQTDAAGTGVEWASNIDIPGTLDVTSAATFDSTVTIAGDLTVNGTTTNINTVNLTVEDKNVIIGDVATPSDVTADGGGITLKGATDKTINWVNATGAWTFSEHVNIASAKEYRIAGTKVLDATSLGSAVVSSSLTSVGTIGTGVWQGTAIADTYLGTISTALKVSNSATTAASANTASAIVARDENNNFEAGTITAALTGAASSNVLKAGDTMTGALVVPLGAFGTPSLTFTGDLNTGIFSPGADQLAVATNGVERVEFGTAEVVFNDGGENYDFRIEGDTNANLLFVDASTDRVGIATSSPATTLDVVGGYFTGGNSRTDNNTKSFGLLLPHFSSATNPVNIIGALSTTGQNLVYIGGSDSNLTGTSATTIQFYTAANATTANGTERARIRADGTFEIKGAGTAGSSPGFSVNPSTPADSFVIDSSGRLGIGTSAPGAPLNVRFDNAGTTTVALFENQRSVGGSPDAAQIVVGARGYNHTIIRQNSDLGTQAIGTTLDTVISNTWGAALHIATGSPTNAARLTVTSAGLVGIGAPSPDAKLHVATGGVGTIAIFQGATGRALYAGTDGSGHYVEVQGTQASERILRLQVFDGGGGYAQLFIDGANKYLYTSSNMNVGIGTPTPTYKLHVNGSFAATTKSFVIPHPTKEGYKLQHGSLEGPENGVYVRGRSGSGVIKLPGYWAGLIDPSSITVTLTPIGQNASLWVERIESNKIYIGREDPSVAYFYMVNAERIDVEPLKVEIPNPS